MLFKLKWGIKRESNDSQRQEISERKTWEELMSTLKVKREEMGLSITELSEKTKISKNVLIALENGITSQIPEKTYLISMLKILEIELGLEKTSLNQLLTAENISKKQQNTHIILPNSLDLFLTWRGNIIYLILLFSCIVVLNIQQKKLSIIHSQTVSPIEFYSQENKNINLRSNE